VQFYPEAAPGKYLLPTQTWSYRQELAAYFANCPKWNCMASISMSQSLHAP
jgi:hypothetical protein